MSIASEITRLQGAKADIKSAIEAKGVTVPSNALLDTFDTYIAQIPSGGGTDTRWQEIGYSDEPTFIQSGIDYAKTIYNNWDASITNMLGKYNGNKNLIFFPLVDTSNVITIQTCFYECRDLVYVPLLNTSKVVTMTYTFYNCTALLSVPLFDTGNVQQFDYCFSGCYALKNIPLFDTGKTKTMKSCFSQCPLLSNDSLNNILKMCINATNYTGTKTLKAIGLTSTQASACQSLSNWADFTDAGWTTGY